MKTYYTIEITSTAKSRGRNSKEYHIFDRQTEHFTTLEAVELRLKEKYGNCKRQKIFRDLKKGLEEPLHIGWVYCFNNDDISHVPVQKWHQQDWVEVWKNEATVVIT